MLPPRRWGERRRTACGSHGKAPPSARAGPRSSRRRTWSGPSWTWASTVDPSRCAWRTPRSRVPARGNPRCGSKSVIQRRGPSRSCSGSSASRSRPPRTGRGGEDGAWARSDAGPSAGVSRRGRASIGRSAPPRSGRPSCPPRSSGAPRPERPARRSASRTGGSPMDGIPPGSGSRFPWAGPRVSRWGADPRRVASASCSGSQSRASRSRSDGWTTRSAERSHPPASDSPGNRNGGPRKTRAAVRTGLA
jgi:hypothetical protein